MNAIPPTMFAITLLWLALCAAAAFALYRQRGKLPQPQLGLLLGGVGLLALAPCTWLLLNAVDEDPSLFGSTVQLLAAVTLFAAAWRARLAQRDPDAGSSRLTYPEKSAMLALGAILFVYAGYFARTWGSGFEQIIPQFIGAIVLLVVIMIVGHIVIALFHAPYDDLEEPADERDATIRLRSVRNAHYAMIASYWILLPLILLPVADSMVLNAWLALLIASEVVYYGSIVAYYRIASF